MIWKLLVWIAHHLVGLFLGVAFAIIIGVRNRSSATELSDGRIEFAPHRLVSAAWILLVLYSVDIAFDFLKNSHGKPFNLEAAACTVFFTVGILFSMPEALVISRDGLQQTYWFRKSKRIRWEEIVEINTGKKDRTVKITGADGTQIAHSRQLADRARLLKELKQHCGENLPPDFPREPG
ncbi:MAG: PH domain-containing protein [Acidobacteriaceae bacterium]